MHLVNMRNFWGGKWLKLEPIATFIFPSFIRLRDRNRDGQSRSGLPELNDLELITVRISGKYTSALITSIVLVPQWAPAGSLLPKSDLDLEQ